MGTILERVKIICDNERMSVGAMEKSIGASKGVLSRAISNGTDVQAKWIKVIVENYPQYNPSWLLTGEGNMLKLHTHVPAGETARVISAPLTIKGEGNVVNSSHVEVGNSANTDVVVQNAVLHALCEEKDKQIAMLKDIIIKIKQT